MGDSQSCWVGFVNREVGIHLTRATEFSRELVALDIDEANHFLAKEALAHTCRRAEKEVSQSAGNIATVTIHIFAEPEAFTDGTDLLFEFTSFFGCKKFWVLGFR